MKRGSLLECYQVMDLWLTLAYDDAVEHRELLAQAEKALKRVLKAKNPKEVAGEYFKDNKR